MYAAATASSAIQIPTARDSLSSVEGAMIGSTQGGAAKWSPDTATFHGSVPWSQALAPS